MSRHEIFGIKWHNMAQILNRIHLNLYETFVNIVFIAYNFLYYMFCLFKKKNVIYIQVLKHIPKNKGESSLRRARDFQVD